MFGAPALEMRPAQELNTVHFRAPEFPSPSSAEPESDIPRPSTTNLGSQRGLPNETPAAPATPTLTWINSSPLSMRQLIGRVVLIDFWEYTCINCIRTFAENKKWYERYHKYGFVIIGVHSPEFDIAYPPQHVRAAVERFGLPYPVVVDSGFQIWNSYHNSTWPNRFLIDARGFVRFQRAGEGGDTAFEHAIQSLLQEAHPGLTFPATYTIPAEEDALAPRCGVPTPEMYVGNWYSRGILANPEGYHPSKTIDYKLPGAVEDGHAIFSGRWETDKNGMIYRGKNKSDSPSSDELKMAYHARELYDVMNASHGRSRLYIKQDGKYLTAENKGEDVQIDSSGRSYLEVREPRMYYLVQNRAFGSHTVELLPTRSGITINSFTFGNDCQTKFPHL
jgi:thiol-disulfide isomerase/thioredoxin